MSGKRRKKISRIMTVIFCAVIIATAVPSFQQDVKANIISDMAGGVIGKIRYNTTVAELILSLLTGSGVAPANQDWINTLNASYGTEAMQLGQMYDNGLFDLVDNEFVDTGWSSAIESAPAYESLHIDDIFEVTQDDVLFEMADNTATAAQTLGGAAVESISKGGLLSKICSGIGVVGLGVALGVQIDKFRQDFLKWYGDNICTNVPIDYNNITYRKGYCAKTYVYRESGRIYEWVIQYPKSCHWVPITRWYAWQGGGGSTQADFYIVNCSDSQVSCYINDNNYQYKVNAHRGESVGSFGPYMSGNVNNFVNFPSNALHFDNIEDCRAYINNLAQSDDVIDTSIPVPSDDVIGVNGNVKVVDEGEAGSPQFVYNNVYNNNIQNNKALKPIDMESFMNWVNQAIQNNQNQATDQEQGDLLQQMINENTVTPETTETPEENPDINYTPSIPEQPTYTDKIPADETDIAASDPYTTPGLRDKFPFCIPFDLASIANIFVSAEREAPHIVFPIRSELFGFEYTIDIDFAAFDEAAGLLRLLELIAFIAGLAVATRQLIGA